MLIEGILCLPALITLISLIIFVRVRNNPAIFLVGAMDLLFIQIGISFILFILLSKDAEKNRYLALAISVETFGLAGWIFQKLNGNRAILGIICGAIAGYLITLGWYVLLSKVAS